MCFYFILGVIKANYGTYLIFINVFLVDTKTESIEEEKEYVIF